jgi:hypothetical protein
MPPKVEEAVALAQTAHIEPDYKDLIIPPNIAPLNFTIKEPGNRFYVNLRGKAGPSIEIRSRRPTVLIPEGPWHRLLVLNRGGQVQIEVSAQNEDGHWRRFAPITNRIAYEQIDPFLLYRKIRAVHNTWSSMGIYQRNLETYDEKPILDNRRFANECCHCHTLLNNSPDAAMVVIRSTRYENSLVLIRQGTVEGIRGTVGTPAWHPTGRMMVFAFSKPRLMLHTARTDMRDIAELEGWIGYFLTGGNAVCRIPGLTDDTRLLAFPTWTPDGRYLYYCNAPNLWTNMAAIRPDTYTTIRYDLMRIAYDVDRDQWGEPETVLPASETRFSIAQPRISPDGRWLFFCACAYGAFPPYDSGSDLYGIDLNAASQTGKATYRKLEVNSPECESWLNWSANSRWIVFSSKRASPLFNRPYLAYVAPNGDCGKAFLVPQKDPAYYDSLLKTYTIPTLAAGPITVPQRKILEAIQDPGRRSLVMPQRTVETRSRDSGQVYNF